MSLPPPPLPLRKKCLQEVTKVCYQSKPGVGCADIKQPGKKITLHGDLVYVDTSGFDLVTKQSIAGNAPGVESVNNIKIRERAVQIDNVLYMVSHVHNVTACTMSVHPEYGELLWVALSSCRVAVYSLQSLKPLVTWIEQCGVQDFSDTNLHRIAGLGENGQIFLYDSLLLDYCYTQERFIMSVPHRTNQLRMSVVSWNVDAVKPPASQVFWTKWLGLEEQPDVIFVGLQEIVDLESTEQLKNNSERVYLWQKTLSGIEGYSVLECVSMVGLALFVLCKGSFAMVKHSSTATLKTGFKGRHGNKGSVGWRGEIMGSLVCVVNCHLTAGQSNISDRNADASLVLKTMKFPAICGLRCYNGGSGEFPEDHELLILFGDLNYRLECSRDIIQEAVKCKSYAQLIDKYDQLRAQQKAHFALSHFSEGPINHPPTYKYDPGTALFDTSEKHRTPSYCDRILYLSPTGAVELLGYSSYTDIHSSDHKPVMAQFLLHTPDNQDRLTKIRWRHIIKAKLIERYIAFK